MSCTSLSSISLTKSLKIRNGASDIRSSRLQSKFSGNFLSLRSDRPKITVKNARISCEFVKKVSSQELSDILTNDRARPVVIDFFATWCGPCVVLAQQLEKLAIEYHGQVDFLKVDTDEEYELASQLQIRGLPTLVFVSSDKEKPASRVEGLLPVEMIKDIISEL